MDPNVPEWITMLIQALQWALPIGAGAMGYLLRELFKERERTLQQVIDRCNALHTERLKDREDFSVRYDRLREDYESRLTMMLANQEQREDRISEQNRQIVDLLAGSIDTLAKARKAIENGTS